MNNRHIASISAAVVFVLVVLSSISQPSTAGVSPLTHQSPLAQAIDPYYVEHPARVTPRPGPYTNQFGETIISEEVYASPHRVAGIIRHKAPPLAQAQGQTTFDSPIGLPPRDYLVYLPLVTKGIPLNSGVMVIAYQPTTPIFDPGILASELISNVRAGTTWHGYAITTTAPVISFYLVDGVIHRVYGPAPQQANGHFNLAQIYTDFNLCNRIAAGEIQEVWIYTDGGHSYSGSEFTINAATWNLYYDTPTPYCGRQIYTMLLNYDVDPSQELESWVHSAETSWFLYLSSGYEACDVFPASGYYTWVGWGQGQCVGSHAYSDLYAFMSRPAVTNTLVGMCGDAHLPPNRPASSTLRSQWYDPTPYPNRCTDWQWGNVTSNKLVSCADWGCTKIGFFTWFLQNAPGLGHNSHGRSGALRPNWWSYRLPL